MSATTIRDRCACTNTYIMLGQYKVCYVHLNPFSPHLRLLPDIFPEVEYITGVFHKYPAAMTPTKIDIQIELVSRL